MKKETSAKSEIDHQASISPLLEATTRIVCAYIKNNPVSKSELLNLIGNVDAALIAARKNGNNKLTSNSKPAVPIKQSLQDDYIVCLEDGLKFKTLKRHLRTKYNMSPNEYRARWSLPDDYPMVARNYAKRRSQIAKDIKLGQETGSKAKASIV